MSDEDFSAGYTDSQLLEHYQSEINQLQSQLAECQDLYTKSLSDLEQVTRERDELHKMLGAMTAANIKATELGFDTIRQQTVERCCEIIKMCEVDKRVYNIEEYAIAAIRAEFGGKNE